MAQPAVPAGGPPKSRAGSDRLVQLLKLGAEIGSMAALFTALLYYFGWARSEAEARAFGADASVFAMSTTDYLLRSADALFLPGFVLLVASYLGIRLHRRLVAASGSGLARRGRPAAERGPGRSAPASPRRSAVQTARLLRFSWVLPILVGIPLLILVPSFGHATFPLWIAVGILGTTYGATLHRVLNGQEPPPLAIIALIAVLLAVTLFWVTERFARAVGEARAGEIKAGPAAWLKPVTLYSVRQLHLSADQVRETPTPGSGTGYQFRYDGLFLLQRSGGKYFFLSSGWNTGQGRLIVLADNESIRVEFGAASTAVTPAPARS